MPASRSESRLLRLLPPALNIPPKEWLRAGIGALLGLFLAGWLTSMAYGPGIALHLLGPLAASAVLVFAVHSGPLAQPWPVLGSYALAGAVGLAMRQGFGPELWVAAVALGISILVMCLLRCLHPPGGGVAVSAVLADPGLTALGDHLLQPVLLNALILVTVAVLCNRLTGVRYPKGAVIRKDLHHTHDPLPTERVGVRSEDLDHALEELGEFVDVTRDELERIILATEQHALQRSLGGITAASVMSRDVQFASPDTTLEQAWAMLASHHLKTLPVLQHGKLVGIVSLSDLVGPAMQRGRFTWRGLFGRPPVRLAQVMMQPVVSVSSQHPLERLLPLLCEQGLHCLPVLDDGRLVGVITQTDLIAGLKRQLLSKAQQVSENRVPAL
ncbi:MULTISPECIES: HPP family protein [Pseudomonas]|jgi:CBS domain-containing membrane protein|uniref:HPP family protein n=1 Tax=Pseudomonas TaxID=286 RepID=UPI00063EF974|nr:MULTISPECIES: HPP family protein [Pseudomonas]KLJ14519.1 CBS domain-containing protein [Pseudomonas sp. TJI-51]MBA6121494.1 HPP family protein [Pseudomonas juntendi]MBI6913293.1 HPP family protein [Pseudomonas juntendi]MCF3155484.1 HPP family protein [Pseudomonas juntendi]MCQ1989626.1 HPP family protein [Pseudomonas sp. Eb3]